MGKLEVDRALIRELAGLLEETGLTEIEVADKEHRLRVARQPAQIAAAIPVATAAAQSATPPVDAQAGAGHPGALKSPMVGTFYRAPEPGAAPFVEIGDAVRKGQTVAVIEAMKTFNEIPSPRDGTVKQILVESGAPVEYGEALMVVD